MAGDREFIIGRYMLDMAPRELFVPPISSGSPVLDLLIEPGMDYRRMIGATSAKVSWMIKCA